MLTNGYHRTRYKLALGLMQAGAILTSASNHPRIVVREGSNGYERGFKLKRHERNPTAPLSPYFFNFRTPDNPTPGPLTEKLVEKAAYCMNCLQVHRDLQFDAVAGVPRAGDPFANRLAQFTRKPCIELDKWELDGRRHVAGMKGVVPADVKKALLADDLITEADSKLEAIGVLEDAGVEVTDVVVLADREEGGREELARRDYGLHSVFTVTELFELAAETGMVEWRFLDELQRYLDKVRSAR